MNDFVVVTDSSADLPKDYIEKHGIITMSLLYTINGETYNSDDEEAAKTFYDKLRDGAMPTTSQVNPEIAKEALIKAVGVSNKVLCLSFSSGLSGTFNSTRIAAEEIMEDNEGVTIKVIDTLAASMGEGLLVYKAVSMLESGISFDDTVQWIEEHKLNLVHVFTASDLFHLYRGGRVKKAAAIVGTVINLKPVLNVDDDGHLKNMFNVRGRKKSLHALVDRMEECLGSYKDKNDIIFISHCDALEDALAVRDEIKERFGYNEFMINPIGPTIGAHSGPDTVALFFFGDNR